MHHVVKRLSVSIIFLMMVLIVTSEKTHADDIISFDGHKQPFEMTNFIDIYEDETRQLTFEDIHQHEPDYHWIPADYNTISRGYTKSAFWVRFQLKNDLNQELLLEVDNALVDRIELYSADINGIYTRKAAGDSLPFNQRDVDYRNVLFKLGKGEDASGKYYLRFTSDISSLQMPLRLWTYSGLSKHFEKSQLILGTYYGIMFGMLILSSLLYVVMKDVLFALYASYLLCFQLLQMSLNGYAYQYLWPAFPYLQSILPTVLTGGSVIFIIMFTRAFLHTQKHMVRVDWLNKIIMFLAGIGVTMAVLGDPGLGVKIAVASGFFGSPVIMIAAVIRVRQGFVPAVFFLLALSVFLCGALILNMTLTGVMPNNFFTTHAMQIGSLGEVILLAVALGDRIVMLQNEKTAVISDTNKELRLLNENLEARVNERTHELVTHNDHLLDLALRDSLTSLLNHNAIFEQLEKLHRDAQRHKFPFAIAMIDIDHFKEVNDKFGHQMGDKVLVAIADCLAKCVRGGDYIGRYGGEEFLLISQRTNHAQANELYKRIIENVAQLKIEKLKGMQVTTSIGAVVNEKFPAKKINELVDNADTALYTAKNAGRNRYIFYESISRTNLVSDTGKPK